MLFRVANYERFLFKRLFRLQTKSVLTVQLNLHQRKSECPCHNEWGREKKYITLLTQRGPSGQQRIKDET